MQKDKKRLTDGTAPTESVLYALERATDFLRGDYNSGVVSCDPVRDCFAPVYGTLVRDVLDDDGIDEEFKATFKQNLAKALAEYFSK